MNHDDLIALLREIPPLHPLRKRQIEASDATAAAAAPLCDKHQPSGGTRSGCLVCGLQAQSAALSKISYLCGPPNEMECGPYDVHCDEDAVVEQVRKALAHVRAEQAEATSYARNLAIALHAQHYSEVAQWRPLGDVLGLLTQIDNMVSSLMKPQPVSGAADPVGLPAGEQTGPVSAAPTLTDDDISEILLKLMPLKDPYKFARAIEAAIHAKIKP